MIECARPALSASGDCASISEAVETIPVRGVRNSWLTLASSCDLAWLARCASSFAACSLLISMPAYSGTTVSSTRWENPNSGLLRQSGDSIDTRPKPSIDTAWHRCMG